MIDYSTQIKNVLDNILPTYYELFCDSSTELPCITYNFYDNYDKEVGDTIGYSELVYTIKLWGDDLSVLVPKAEEMDKAMRVLGFRRLSSSSLGLDN